MAALCWIFVLGFIISGNLGLEPAPRTWRFAGYLTCVPMFAVVTIFINAMAFHRNPLGWGGTGLVAAIPVLTFSVFISVMMFGFSGM